MPPSGERHRKAADRCRIVLELGDNLVDFIVAGKGKAEERPALVEKYRDGGGARRVILPNAAYGCWEAALYGFDCGTPHANKPRRKMDALKP